MKEGERLTLPFVISLWTSLLTDAPDSLKSAAPKEFPPATSDPAPVTGVNAQNPCRGDFE